MNHLQDTIWDNLRNEAEQTSLSEPILSSVLSEFVIDRKSLVDALSWRVASRLAKGSISESDLRSLFFECFSDDAGILASIAHDLDAVKERDPACNDYLSPFLYFKGFQALCSYRACHRLWSQERSQLALYLQSLVSVIYSVDIHRAGPADPLPAGPPECQGGVGFALDLDQGIKDHGSTSLGVDVVGHVFWSVVGVVRV